MKADIDQAEDKAARPAGCHAGQGGGFADRRQVLLGGAAATGAAVGLDRVISPVFAQTAGAGGEALRKLVAGPQLPLATRHAMHSASHSRCCSSSA
jgi:hypothetical protein